MFHMFEKINQGSPYLIAEMSANHAGKLENALEIVRESAKAGADCVKIQTYTADTLTIDCDNECFRIKDGLWEGYRLYDLYRDAGTPWEWQARIKEECGACGVDFLSTPFDRTAVDFLERIGCEAYKIASFELVDLPLIEYAASKGKPMILSCGMGSLEEIQDAVDACRRVGNRQIVLLKCCSEYPADWADMHLGNIPDMQKRFGVHVGLSDHSMGSLGAVVGAALGACVVEKHVCLSRNIKNPDSEFSMEMDEFAKMAQDVKNAKLIARGPEYELSEKEKDSLVFRRSLFAVKDIGVGERFTVENVRSIRPGYGLAPKFMASLLGKKSKRVVRRGEPITREMMEGT
ncbi:MAG: pseudaminic acid synthase [Lachnospiraceae bacterium]|nr:pseudaminic acid synthase [Lachnospiraceae bacterium]